VGLCDRAVSLVLVESDDRFRVYVRTAVAGKDEKKRSKNSSFLSLSLISYGTSFSLSLLSSTVFLKTLQDIAVFPHISVSDMGKARREEKKKPFRR